MTPILRSWPSSRPRATPPHCLPMHCGRPRHGALRTGGGHRNPPCAPGAPRRGRKRRRHRCAGRHALSRRRETSHGSAVFANAVLLSGRVQGDSHPCGHIGGVVIPAAIASAERAGTGGRAMLSSLVAGYEVALRIGRDHAADSSKRGFRTTPCYGVFGAVAAAARAQRFDSARTANAIALAANFAGGSGSTSMPVRKSRRFRRASPHATGFTPPTSYRKASKRRLARSRASRVLPRLRRGRHRLWRAAPRRPRARFRVHDGHL